MVVGYESFKDDIQLFLYAFMFKYIDDLVVNETEFTITIGDDIYPYICDALEEFEGYNGIFPTELYQLHMYNTSQHISDKISKLLDSKAQEFRYDDMKSARSYTGFESSFQAEAIALSTWGTNCWGVAGTIEYEVKNGTRAMPTVAEAISEMPEYLGV